MSTLTNDDVVKALGDLTVLELIALTKELEAKWGVKAEPVFTAPIQVPTNNPVVQEQTEFSITLVSFPMDKKIAMIKLIRDVLGLGLVDAKSMVESLPKMIKEGINKDEVEALKAKFTEAGATVEIK